MNNARLAGIELIEAKHYLEIVIRLYRKLSDVYS